MRPANHRTLTLVQAIREFALERLLDKDFDDVIGNRLEDDDSVLVFDGDTISDEDLDLLQRDMVFGEPWDRQRHGLIIVNGSLAMNQIDLYCVDGLIVLGDLLCDSIHLREELLYVQGNLVARSAVRATASQDWNDVTARTLGQLHVHVRRTASSPRVQTWHLPLHHLRWTEGSGIDEALELE